MSVGLFSAPRPADPVNVSTSEEAVVCAVLRQPDCLREVAQIITPADFRDPTMGALYGLVVAMKAASEPVDLAALSGKCETRGAPYPERGHLRALFATIVTTEHVGYHAKTVLTGAIGRRLQQAAVRTYQSVERGEDPALTSSKAASEFAEIRDGNTGDGFDMKTLGELLAGSDDYDWLIPGLFERQDRLMLTGTEGSGKTYFVRQLCILAAAGINPVTFDQIDPVRVSVIDVENTERQWIRTTRGLAARAKRFGSADPSETLQIKCAGRLDITSPAHLGAVHRVIDEHRPDILAIGPLYKLVPGAINTDDDAAPLIAALDSIRDRGVSLVMEAHAGHSQGGNGERNLRPRGSSALLGWPEFGYGLAPIPPEEGENDPAVTYARLGKWRGDRDQRAWPAKLMRGTSSWPWIDADMDSEGWMRHSDRRMV